MQPVTALEGASEYVRLRRPTVPSRSIPAAETLAHTSAAQPNAATSSESAATRRGRRNALWTAAGSIGVGAAVLQLDRLFFAEFASITQRFIIGTFLVCCVYVIVGSFVRGQLRNADVTPRYATGIDDTKSIAIGVAVGLALAGGLVWAGYVVTGEVSSDPSIVAPLYERAWIFVAFDLLITVIAAPLVEEMLFRGLLVEALRSKGMVVAILGGSVAFSLWHLRPELFFYYAIAGILLGLLYWRHGLNASIAAHALFNATLFVCAFAAVGGPAHVESLNGVTVTLPAAWRVVDPEPFDSELTLDLAVEAPTGSGFAIQHLDAPPGSLSSLHTLVPPGAAQVRPVSISDGAGLRYSERLDGRDADSVLAARGSRVFIVTFVSSGSDTSLREFEDIVGTIVLPLV